MIEQFLRRVGYDRDAKVIYVLGQDLSTPHLPRWQNFPRALWRFLYGYGAWPSRPVLVFLSLCLLTWVMFYYSPAMSVHVANNIRTCAASQDLTVSLGLTFHALLGGEPTDPAWQLGESCGLFSEIGLIVIRGTSYAILISILAALTGFIRNVENRSR
jgi:hypothetical protein